MCDTLLADGLCFLVDGGRSGLAGFADGTVEVVGDRLVLTSSSGTIIVFRHG